MRPTGLTSGAQAAITEANDRASIVPDSSFYIRHPDKLEEADFGPLLNVWQSLITVLSQLSLSSTGRWPSSRWRPTRSRF
jgi:hypothetical protein